MKHIIDLAAYNRRSAIVGLTPLQPDSHTCPAVILLDSRSEVAHTWPGGRSELPSAIVYNNTCSSRPIRSVGVRRVLAMRPATFANKNNVIRCAAGDA